MKIKFFQCSVLICFLLSTAYAQSKKDSFLLEIKSLKKAGIILSHFVGEKSNFLTEDPRDVAINSASWPLMVRSSVPGVFIVIKNNEGDGDSAKLTDINKKYIIAGDSLIGTKFMLTRSIQINIVNAATGQMIKGFPIPIVKSDATTTGGTQGKPDDPTGYKVGSMIFDAMYLSTGSSNVIKGKILSYYGNNLTGKPLVNEYSTNGFLASIASSILNKAGGQGAGIGLGSILSSVGGRNVTGLADGAAKFVVKRVKQELSIAFFKKLKKVLQETPDIATIFPQTANLLDGLDEEIYEYEKYIQNLREAFKKDIQTIHRNLPGIIDNHPMFFEKHQEVKAALLTACYTAQELEDEAHPGDILANYPTEYLDGITNKNYKGAIQTIQLLSASLKDTSAKEDATYWADIKQIRALVNDKLALKIYLGLLLQEAKIKYDGVAFKGTTLVELLNKVADDYDKVSNIYNSYKTYVLRFGEKVAALNTMIKDQNKDNLSDSVTIEKYAKFFRTSVDLAEYSVEICNLPVIKSIGHFEGFPLLLKKYFDVSYSSVDLVVDITRKNYSSAINHAVHIYNVVTVKSSQESDAIAFTETKTVEDVNISSDSQAVRKEITASSGVQPISASKGFKTTYDNLIKYGSFMATVATAKNSDEVEQAIETAALPVGSSRIKRVSNFNVSLNAYAGLFYGIERIKGVDSGGAKFNSFGVTAPIGVAASWGHSLFFIPTGKHEWSTSIYVSLIDLGAIAAFRFRDDSTAQVPDIELKDIFSPGVFLSLGIPKTPLSLNLGAQVGPNLRKVGTGKNDYGDNVYWRYSVSLCVDIPVFNLYTKSK